MDTGTELEKPRPGAVAIGLAVVGVLGYLAVGFVYLSSGLVVPFPWLAGLWAIWVGGAFVMGRTLRQRPAWSVLVPVAAFGIWIAVLLLGERLLGWTA